MNKNQSVVGIVVVSIMLAMMLFPPFEAIREQGTFNLGYGFIFMPPEDVGTVNIGLLFMQWILVFFCGAITWLMLKDK